MAEASNKSKLREWTPTDTNQVPLQIQNVVVRQHNMGILNCAQIRLRHLCKICIRSICLDPPTTSESAVFYYTLHITTMSAPFYTSENQSGENIDWNDLDTRKFPESIVNSCPGIKLLLNSCFALY